MSRQEFDLFPLPRIRHVGSNGWMICPMTALIAIHVADLLQIGGGEPAHERRNMPGVAAGFSAHLFGLPGFTLFGTFDSPALVQVVFTAPIPMPDCIWRTEQFP